MPKTNFSKAEEALSEAVHKMFRLNLLTQADAAQGNYPSPTKEDLKQRNLLIQALQRGLKRLQKHDKEIYKKLGTKQKELEKLFQKFETLSDEEWEAVKQVRVRVAELVKLLPEEAATDAEIIKQQRKKHINKRFNVSDKWLPLT